MPACMHLCVWLVFVFMVLSIEVQKFCECNILCCSCEFDCMCVVKFLRAHGGCLGIRSRRRT